MARYRNVATGVLVEAADTLALGSEWGPVDGAPVQSESPDSTWKVVDLKAYATENSIDLGDATKKDDIVAAIAAAGSGDGSSDDSDQGSGPDE